jgi:signal transduction histidine kinase/CheY-like chemotaxis protein
MQGVLIASGSENVRRALSVIVGQGKTVYECPNLAESLALASAQRMDYVFVDNVLPDGTAEELVERLHMLGYGFELVPLLLSDDAVCRERFQALGVRHTVVKPFGVAQIEQVLDHIEALRSGPLRPPVSSPFAHDVPVNGVPQGGEPAQAAFPGPPSADADIRGVSQRFRRLLERSLRRGELVGAFAESVQEQFDTDNVVILVPARDAPCLRIAHGQVDETTRGQFYVPFGEPLLAALVRIGEPVCVDENRYGLPAPLAGTLRQYGERLGVRHIAAVASRGRVLALVGLSRIHRYTDSGFCSSLLRMFLTFFAKALENAELHARVLAAEQTYRGIFDAVPSGAVVVRPDGEILELNPCARRLLGIDGSDLLGQPIEKAGSLLADAAREVLVTGAPVSRRKVPVGDRVLTVSAVPVGDAGGDGALVLLEPVAVEPDHLFAPVCQSEDQYQILRDMARTLAHKFKNDFVSVKIFADMLQERYDQEQFRQSFSEVVQDSIAKIDASICALLRFHELPDAGGRRTVFPVHEAVLAGIQEARTAFPDTRPDIRTEFVQDDLVNACREAMEQVFYEIVHNAIDAVQDVPSPRVMVVTSVEGESVVVRVTDSGDGFDPEVKAAACRPFFTRKLSGLGLGLTYVRKVSEMHGGRLEIESRPAEGATVVVTLPQVGKVSLVSG